MFLVNMNLCIYSLNNFAYFFHCLYQGINSLLCFLKRTLVPLKLKVGIGIAGGNALQKMLRTD